MLLRKDDPWSANLQSPDIRNWRVIDSTGRSLGFVESVVIDREHDRIEAFLTGANERFVTEDAEIGDGVVQIGQPLERRISRPADAPAGRGRFEDAYRKHFQDRFQSEDAQFGDYREAYAFGRRMALDAHYSGRAFERAEEDLRGEWVSGDYRLPYTQARDAIWFAYRLVQSDGKYEIAGMNREGEQIIGPSKLGRKRSADAGVFMATGTPNDGRRG